MKRFTIDPEIALLTLLASIIAAVFMLYLCLLYVDITIHKTLYGFGLQFSHDWANPYWTTKWLMFALLGAITAFSFSIYLLHKKPEAPLAITQEKTTLQKELEMLETLRREVLAKRRLIKEHLKR